MVSSREVAQTHLDRRLNLTHRATRAVLRQWGRVDFNNLDGSWALVSPELVGVVAAAQVTAARQTAGYLNRVGEFYDDPSTARVAVESFGGVTQDGRELGPALYGAVAKTKQLSGAGRPAFEALHVGAVYLAMVAGAAVQDMGRMADMVGAVGRGWVRYVRVVSPGACSRCAILAGSDRYTSHFLRHPRCKCQSWPIAGTSSRAVPDGLFETPGDYFESLTPSDQDRVFTKAGAEAIRNGANPVQVVNARRGAYGAGYNAKNDVPAARVRRMQPVTIGKRPDGSPLQVYATAEGTTVRGVYGRTSSSVRLMPEQIVSMADGNPERMRDLLRRYGYLY